jgi:uncharacterized protein YukE
LLNAIKTGSWIPEGLAAGAGMAALEATMRPIDELPRAGLDWLVPYVEPLQGVLERMAGKAAVIQSFADAWQRASDQVEEIHQRLADAATRDTADWHGDAADNYRRRARELALALDAAARVASATSIVARQMGEVIADARQKVNDLLTDLVSRLISYARQAVAAEGGVTPNVIAQCTNMINSYQSPIAEIERKLEQALDSVQPPTSQPGPGSGPSGGDIADILATIASVTPVGRVIRGIAAAWRFLRGIFGRRGSGGPGGRPPQEVTVEQMVRAIRNSPKTRIGRVRPPRNWPPSARDGYDMQPEVDRVVRERYPDVRFDSARRGETGPDMRVTGARRDPGFDWVEIKPDTDSGIRTFVRDEWGRTPEWTGRGRIITYDRAGNVYEIDFPASTHP